MTYTGAGDGTSASVTFKSTPLILLVSDQANAQSPVIIFSDGVRISCLPGNAATNSKDAASTAISTTTVDMDKVNTALGLSGADDLNKLNVVYDVFALESS